MRKALWLSIPSVLFIGAFVACGGSDSDSGGAAGTAGASGSAGKAGGSAGSAGKSGAAGSGGSTAPAPACDAPAKAPPMMTTS